MQPQNRLHIIYTYGLTVLYTATWLKLDKNNMIEQTKQHIECTAIGIALLSVSAKAGRCNLWAVYKMPVFLMEFYLMTDKACV